MTSYFIDLKSGTFGAAQPADTAVHFPSNGTGGLTTQALASGASTYTSTSATPAGNVGTAGTQGYAFTNDGYYAAYTVTTGGAGGTIAVEAWLNQNFALNGGIPTGTITLHTASIAARFQCVAIESLQLHGNSAVTNLSITDPVGTVLRGFKIPAAPTPTYLELGEKALEVKGPFGIIVSAVNQLDATISFNMKRAVYGRALLPAVF